MTTKGFAETGADIATPIDKSTSEKPLKTKLIRAKRVDINELKSKLQQSENQEFKKNVYILSSLVLMLSLLGIYLSL